MIRFFDVLLTKSSEIDPLPLGGLASRREFCKDRFYGLETTVYRCRRTSVEEGVYRTNRTIAVYYEETDWGDVEVSYGTFDDLR